MVLNFTVNQAMYLAFARGEAEPLVRALRALPGIPRECQWANFVRNHDELTLDKLSESEREEVFAAFGPDPEHQLFGRGLRRRLPSMVGEDQDRIRLAYSLAFSLPGTPVLFYGEEIGMRESLEIPGRMSVRSPMQWSSEPQRGFTTGEPARPVAPGEAEVAAQRRDPDSLLTWMELLIRRRRECPELGWGEVTILDAGDPAVLAHRADWDDTTILAVHSFAEEPREVTIEVGEADAVVDLFGPDELEAARRPRRRSSSAATGTAGSASAGRASASRPSVPIRKFDGSLRAPGRAWRPPAASQVRPVRARPPANASHDHASAACDRTYESRH